MAWLIVILLLLAAAFGVLGAVVKAVAFLVLTVLLTVAALVAIAWYGFKQQIRRWERGAVAHREGTWGRADDSRDLPSHDDRY